jgi:hypothetical protein
VETAGQPVPFPFLEAKTLPFLIVARAVMAPDVAPTAHEAVITTHALRAVASMAAFASARDELLEQ